MRRLQRGGERLFADNVDYTPTENLIEKGQEALFAKIDYFKCTFYNSSIDNVLLFLGIDPNKVVTDFVRACKAPKGFNTKFTVDFFYNGILFQVPCKGLPDFTENDDCFSVMNKILYLSISGQGLDYIRYYHNQEIESYLINKESYIFYFPDGYFITRVDYAFDFINWHDIENSKGDKVDIIDLMHDYIINNQSDSGRLVCCGTSGSLKYKMLYSAGRSIYIGSRNSPQLIRFYDKKAEFTSSKKKDKGLYVKSNPFCNPDRWVRIELEAHDNRAMDYLFSDLDYPELLNKIVSSYAFADLSTPAHRRQPIPFWKEYFNWEHIKEIHIRKQNPYFVPFEGYADRRINKVLSSIHQSIVDDMIVEKSGIDLKLQKDKYLLDIQNGTRSGKEIENFLWQKLVDKLGSADISIDDIEKMKNYYFDENNFLRVRF